MAKYFTVEFLTKNNVDNILSSFTYTKSKLFTVKHCQNEVKGGARFSSLYPLLRCIHYCMYCTINLNQQLKDFTYFYIAFHYNELWLLQKWNMLNSPLQVKERKWKYCWWENEHCKEMTSIIDPLSSSFGILAWNVWMNPACLWHEKVMRVCPQVELALHCVLCNRDMRNLQKAS